MRDMPGWIWLAIIFGGLGVVVVWAAVTVWIDDVKRRRRDRSRPGGRQ